MPGQSNTSPAPLIYQDVRAPLSFQQKVWQVIKNTHLGVFFITRPHLCTDCHQVDFLTTLKLIPLTNIIYGLYEILMLALVTGTKEINLVQL